MTQAAVNNAIVLHRLSVSREDVRRADELYSKTSELQRILTNPEIPLAKKYDIIDKVFALDDTKELMKNFIKEMCKLGYCDEMRDIFDSYYRIDDEANHILKAELISADSSDEDDNAKQAQDFLKSRYPDYTIELTKTVDADLLGGYVIRAHHKEYDRSFEGAVRNLDGLRIPLRLHQEDFAQALGIAAQHKYECNQDKYLQKAFELIRNYSANPMEDQLKLWDITVYNYLIESHHYHL